MVRLAKPEIGEIVIDPMCGGGSISIEVRDDTLAWTPADQAVYDRLLLVGPYLTISLGTIMIWLRHVLWPMW